MTDVMFTILLCFVGSDFHIKLSYVCCAIIGYYKLYLESQLWQLPFLMYLEHNVQHWSALWPSC